jgi:hypothetical protein
MNISEWQAVDDQIVIQVNRVTITEVVFHLGDKTEQAWSQVRASTKQLEKLASVLFDQRVCIQHELFRETLEWMVIPYNHLYRKPKDQRIRTRQPTFPGARPVIRPPMEGRKRWGDPYRQTDLVDGIEPDIEAEVRGASREIDAEVIHRDVTRTRPSGGSKVVRKLPIPTLARLQDLMLRLSLAAKSGTLETREGHRRRLQI